MTTQYVTKSGDLADEIAWNYYGTRDGRVVERLLDANPGLADYGPVLPPGITINLPAFTLPATQSAVNLWD